MWGAYVADFNHGLPRRWALQDQLELLEPPLLVALEKGNFFDPELHCLLLLVMSSSARIFSYPQEIIESDEREVSDGLLSLAGISCHCHLDEIFWDVGFDRQFLHCGQILLLLPV